MNSPQAFLRLGRLPKSESVKLMFVCPVALKEDLDRYAALHSQIHGDEVDSATLIPHMLAAFMERDRGFKKGSLRTKSQPQVARGSASSS